MELEMKFKSPVRTLSPAALIPLLLCMTATAAAAATKIPDTGQNRCYNETKAVACPDRAHDFFGQDAQYSGAQPAYRDNGDGTVTDRVTGLMWSKAVSPQKVGLEEARQIAQKMRLGGYDDWRVPNIKELYSLIDFRGYTGSADPARVRQAPADAVPFIDTDYFDFRYGAEGERYIDAQWLSSTPYVATTMGDMETLFGVNFADGRIKGYGYKRLGDRWERKKFYVRYVRGGSYGESRFKDNGDATVTDQATGLMWSRSDSGRGMDWRDALDYAENLELAGYRDWRLPNAKELQYIVDYTRSPETTGSAAIDPVFQSSAIVNEAGERDYPAYWTSTTHLDGPRPGTAAVYVAFGRALGEMQGRIMDVHGAGAQRSDPKTGRAELGRGPQGDAVRVDNYVRVVRGGATAQSAAGGDNDYNAYPYRIRLADESDSDAAGAASRQPPFPGDTRPGFAARDPAAFAKHFVERLDRDGDGRVSRSEFDGPKQRFGFHDGNGDGYLTVEEIEAAPPPPPPFGKPRFGRGDPGVPGEAPASQ